MDFRRKEPSIRQGLLRRSRIDGLLKKAVGTPFVTMIAGLGYGKTQAVASFAKGLREADGRVLWLNLSSLDNIVSRFWQSFLWPFRDRFPQAAERLETLGFPDTADRYDSFLHVVAAELYNGAPCILVVDDYASVQNPEIRRFFTRLVEAELENSCILLLSSARTDLGLSRTDKDGGVFRITADDLKFTAAETRELFALYGVRLAEPDLRKVENAIDGWPLALHLLAMYLKGGYGIKEATLADMSLAFGLFEKECFSGYTAGARRLLIKLSMLQEFSADIVRSLCAGAFEEAEEAVENNVFISYDPASRSFAFQKMYREFLAQKQFMIDPDETNRIYSTAGDWFFEKEKLVEAIECYGKCAAYDKMFEAIRRFPTTLEVTPDLADFFLRHFDLPPPEFLERNPMAAYLKASLYLNNLEVDRAFELLIELEKKLEKKEGDEESRLILGEVCRTLAGICMLRNDDGFVRYFRKASYCLPHGSHIVGRNAMLVDNNPVLFLQDKAPGELKRMERAVHEAVPYMEHVLNGSLRGFGCLYSASAAYNTFDFEAAERHARRAVRRARENGQHDIVCAARFLMARIALMRGDYEETERKLNGVVRYIEERNLVALYNVRDSAESWFYIKMDDLGKVTPWILTDGAEKRDRAPIDVGRGGLLYAAYLLRKGEFYELLALLEGLEDVYFRRGFWIYRLDVHIMRAIAHLKTGKVAPALLSFWEAYDMAWANGIVTPFVEAGAYVCALIDTIRKLGTHSFDKAWLDDVYGKASAYAKRRLALIARYAKKNGAHPHRADFGLSRRETEVLLNLAQGLTREEIAAFHKVSVNTVKSQIKNIYNKLGAVNRADAIHIATKSGIMG